MNMIKHSRLTAFLLCSAVFLPFATMMAEDKEKKSKPVPDGFRTALIYDDVFLEHDTGPGFPEHPDRLRRLTKHLKENEISKRLMWVKPDEKIDPLPWIHEMHDKDYVAALKRACEAGEKRMHGSGDTPMAASDVSSCVR